MLLDKIKPGGNGLRAALVATGIGLFATTGATAGTFVTDWTYKLDNGFVASTIVDIKTACTADPTLCPSLSAAQIAAITGSVTGSVPNVFLAPPVAAGDPFAIPNFTKLEWPDPPVDLGNSSIDVDSANAGSATGSVATNGGFENTVSISHVNNTQSLQTNFLHTVTLLDVLRLTPVAPPPFPDGSELTAPPITIAVRFVETINSGNPTGSPDDIFVLDIGGAGFNPVTNTIDQPFTFDMIDYVGIIRLVDSMGNPALGVLSDARCALAGEASGCVGLVTTENATTTFQAQVAITGTPPALPEPGTLAILGMGLAGLGVARRRRKA